MVKVFQLNVLLVVLGLCSGCVLNLPWSFGDYGQRIKVYDSSAFTYEGYKGMKYEFLFELKWNRYKKLKGVQANIMGKLEEDLLFRDILTEELLKIKLCPNGYVLEDQGTWGKGAIYSIGGICKK